MLFKILVLIHVLSATIWTGGHLILTTRILPGVLKNSDVDMLRDFEARYESIGIPALLLQIITGLWMARIMLPDWSAWFDMSNIAAFHIMIKLVLLLLTALLAVDARFRVIPNLDASRLTDMAVHIIAITVLAVLFVITGVSLSTGGLY
ncbi:MAG: copper resistance protein CopD [Calditrichaeota bacterium]|nr:MAG: copper resistance protein CopD [Calditrichota bacterium]